MDLRRQLTFLVLTFIAFTSVCVGYVITTPRKWPSGRKSQVCITFSTKQIRGDYIQLFFSASSNQFHSTGRLRRFNRRASTICKDIHLPLVNHTEATLKVEGQLEGQEIDFTKDIAVIPKAESFKTYVQTDKYLYSSLQTVQIRILTLEGPFLDVFKGKYSNIWIEDPKNYRLKEWKNNKTEGILHLHYKLPEETTPGIYSVKVLTDYGEEISGIFEVKPYVLPRFEVKIQPPSYLLSNMITLKYEVCADYTFGEPVKGTATITLSGSGDKKIKLFKKATGCEIFNFGKKETKRVFSRFTQWMHASAQFEEEGTGMVQTSNPVNITIQRQVLAFKDISRKSYTKVNLPYLAEFRVSFQDGSPAANELMRVCVSGGVCKDRNTDPQGIMDFALPSHLLKETITIESVNYKEVNDGYSPLLLEASKIRKTFGEFHSVSDSSLLIAIDERRLECIPGNKVRFNVPVWIAEADQDNIKVTIQIMSRGQIFHAEATTIRKSTIRQKAIPITPDQYISPPINEKNVGTFTLLASLPYNVSPRIKILVFYSRSDGNLVSDSRTLDISECQLDNVRFNWSHARARPGDNVDMFLESEGDSLCSIGVVDKGVELLRPSDQDDISMSKLMEQVEKFDVSPDEKSLFEDDDYCQADVPSNHIDPLHVFNDAGVYVMTDLFFQKQCLGLGRSSGGDTVQPRIVWGDNPSATDALSNENDGSNEQVLPRRYFPETWLWNLETLPSTGKMAKSYKMPHSLTEWVGKAVCIRPKKGIAVSPEASITTFQDFFIDLNLPPTAKRGEILPVKVSVFNYLKVAAPVRVMLPQRGEFEIVSSGGQVRSSCIEAQSKTVHTFNIRPKVAGLLKIPAVALLDHGLKLVNCSNVPKNISRMDVLIKEMSVEIEGFTKEKIYSEYICVSDYLTGADFVTRTSFTWDVELPSSIVKGSVRGYLTAVGSSMAITIENLGGLLKVPTGCAEQTMINVAPSIYVLEYFYSFGDKENQVAKDTAKSYIEQGYANVLKYLLPDGSFEVFGRDPGSTWLTAFVLRCFWKAQDFVTIDKGILSKTKNWLKGLQDSDGCFPSQGRFYHTNMMGGVHSTKSSSSSALTSFVLITLLEAEKRPAYSKHVKEAIKCIKRDNTNHPYTLAIKAFAFAKALEKDESNRAIDLLLTTADESGEIITWKAPGGEDLLRGLNLETTGYLMLAMIQCARIDLLFKFAKSINKQRNANGGFYSTQDTVVALQALAAYEEEMFYLMADLKIKTKVDLHERELLVDESNKLITKRTPLFKGQPSLIQVDVEGEGCTLIQGVFLYNIPNLEDNPAFNLRVNSTKESCTTQRLEVCTNYNLQDPKSNMAMVEVEIITGYRADSGDVDKIVHSSSTVSRKEYDRNKVILYLDEIPSNEICFDFRIHKKYHIEDRKEAIVSVYDYYNPDDTTRTVYTLNDC